MLPVTRPPYVEDGTRYGLPGGLNQPLSGSVRTCPAVTRRSGWTGQSCIAMKGPARQLRATAVAARVLATAPAVFGAAYLASGANGGAGSLVNVTVAPGAVLATVMALALWGKPHQSPSEDDQATDCPMVSEVSCAIPTSTELPSRAASSSLNDSRVCVS